MNFISNKNLVSKTPIITSILLEYANIGQLYRMWAEHSAKGQSIWSWASVGLALWLWLNFYRVMLPNEKFAYRATIIGIILNALVILSVLWFNYIVHK